MLVLWTMTAAALYALGLHGESAAEVGLKPPNDPLWFAAGPFVVLFLLSVSGAGRRDIAEPYARAVRAVVPRTAADWAWFVPVAASAGACEEFLYRGYALTQVAALTHSVVAGVILSSLAFGLGHAYQGRIGMAGTAVTGLLYSGLFLLSGSLLPCMVAHFLQDIFGARLLSSRLYSQAAPAVGQTRSQGE